MNRRKFFKQLSLGIASLPFADKPMLGTQDIEKTFDTAGRPTGHANGKRVAQKNIKH